MWSGWSWSDEDSSVCQICLKLHWWAQTWHGGRLTWAVSQVPPLLSSPDTHLLLTFYYSLRGSRALFSATPQNNHRNIGRGAVDVTSACVRSPLRRNTLTDSDRERRNNTPSAPSPFTVSGSRWYRNRDQDKLRPQTSKRKNTSRSGGKLTNGSTYPLPLTSCSARLAIVPLRDVRTDDDKAKRL